MPRKKKSEQLFIEKITHLARALSEQQRGLEIGELLSLIRKQLGMSQRVLARRSKIPQSTISRIESGRLEPKKSTLEKILDSMSCDLLISIVPRDDFEVVRRKQAEAKARMRIQYLHGTMSLEKQEPNHEFLNELLDREVKQLLESSDEKLWEEER